MSLVRVLLPVKCFRQNKNKIENMSDFDDRSGVVAFNTEWGKWSQTMDEVWIHVKLVEGTRAKDIRCDVSTKKLDLCVKGQVTFQGELFREVHADDTVWTIEDKKLLVICLPKSDRTASNCWRSLLVGQYEADPWTWEQMQQKLTLERFQIENPGMDFSGASISGSYQGGGPELPS